MSKPLAAKAQGPQFESLEHTLNVAGEVTPSAGGLRQEDSGRSLTS